MSEHAQTLMAAIAGNRLMVLQESGHSPMIETTIDYNLALLYLHEVLG